jgi:hypothetical protein
MSPRWPGPPAGTATPSAPTPSSCWIPTCRGPRCGRACRLLGLVRRYGAGPVETACARALELDVVNVTKIASMLEKATENASPPPPRAVASAARFARDPAEYRSRHIQLTLIEGGEASR